MSTPAISNADMVESQLRKWVSKRGVRNVKFRPAYSHPSVPKGETVIAEVIDRSGQGLFFTGSGFTLPSLGFIPYANVAKATWISAQPDHVRFARKREDFDHIELSLRDGSSATLTDVQQAVFPLLRFFEWLTNEKNYGGENYSPRE